MTDPRIEKIARALAMLNVENDDNWRLYIQDAEAALSAIGQVWQPIETVPKDGTKVDLWCSHVLHGSVRAPDARYHVNNWVIGDLEERLNPDWIPTHWILPPEAPES